jgi:hypothetical protein
MVSNILHVGVLQKYFSDLNVAWPLVLAMLAVSLFISIFYSVLIRYFAGCMVWSMIIFLMLLLLCIGLVTALMPEVQFIQDIFDYNSLPDTLKDRTFQIVISSLTLTSFAVGLLLICCMKRQIIICNF